MTNKTFGNRNWREEYKNYMTSEFHQELLDNGAISLSQIWILGALYQKSKKKKVILLIRKENEQ